MTTKEFTTYGFFDSKDDGDDRYEYTSEEFCDFVKGIIGDGVSATNYNKFALTLNGLDATLDTGEIFIGGRYAIMESTTTLTMTATSASTEYTIYAVSDTAQRTISLAVASGHITSDDSNYDYVYYPLYYVTCVGSVTTLSEDARNYCYDPINTVNALNTKIDTAISALEAKITPAYIGAATATHTHNHSELTGIYYGSDEPTNPSVNDIWFKPVE